MDVSYIATRLMANASVIEGLVRHVTPEQACWKPAADRWSMLEVVCHLYDEERLDFRARVDLLLNHPTRPWPPIDSEGWVREHRYNEQDLVEMIALFKLEREESVAWLRTLDDANWSATYGHPQLGPITAGSLLGSWLAHDWLHVRQIAGLEYKFVARQVMPHSLKYAGNW